MFPQPELETGHNGDIWKSQVPGPKKEVSVKYTRLHHRVVVGRCNLECKDWCHSLEH